MKIRSARRYVAAFGDMDVLAARAGLGKPRRRPYKCPQLRLII
jgi:hypothetical protein